MSVERGHATAERIAAAIAMEHGVPVEHAFKWVRALFEAIRDEIERSPRVVLPGLMVIERLPEGAVRSHRVRFTYNKAHRTAAAMRRMRERNRAG